jgi:AbiJ N-terminal domain 4
MRFSDRVGITNAAKIIQKEFVDDDLRNSLWNALSNLYWKEFKRGSGQKDIEGSNLEDLIVSIWQDYFKIPSDKIRNIWEECLEVIRRYFFKAQWYEIYNFIEFIVNNEANDKSSFFINECNFYLSRENSAYRFVGKYIAEITSTEEIEEIEKAILLSSPYAGVKAHFSAAISLMSDKINPDYRNSIKESISAVESLAIKISNGSSDKFGVILKDLEQLKIIHPALKNAFSSLYGYTSDAGGIRHALLDEPNLTKTDARFMLIACSAFVNYIIENLNQ